MVFTCLMLLCSVSGVFSGIHLLCGGWVQREERAFCSCMARDCRCHWLDGSCVGMWKSSQAVQCFGQHLWWLHGVEWRSGCPVLWPAPLMAPWCLPGQWSSLVFMIICFWKRSKHKKVQMNAYLTQTHTMKALVQNCRCGYVCAFQRFCRTELCPAAVCIPAGV